MTWPRERIEWSRLAVIKEGRPHKVEWLNWLGLSIRFVLGDSGNGRTARKELPTTALYWIQEPESVDPPVPRSDPYVA